MRLDACGLSSICMSLGLSGDFAFLLCKSVVGRAIAAMVISLKTELRKH
jgi:hypothetical protein